jgi:hypothetical protein
MIIVFLGSLGLDLLIDEIIALVEQMDDIVIDNLGPWPEPPPIMTHIRPSLNLDLV